MSPAQNHVTGLFRRSLCRRHSLRP